MKRRYGAVSLSLVLSVLVAVMATVMVVRVVDAITFETTLTATVSNPVAGAEADVTTDFGIPKGSAQFFAQATFTPPEFDVSAGADIPAGAIVGELNANATLGLINGPCNSALPVSVDTMNATTDTSTTVTFDDQFQDADANTLPDSIDKYPDFLTRMFPGLTPRARYFGQASVAGSAVSLNFVIFEPGVTIPGLGALDPAWGYPAVSVLNNNGDPGAVAAPSPITDFCTPLSTESVVFGTSKDNPATSANESGATVQSNPTTPGTYTFRSRAISQYDADDDNIENGLDTCPYDVNVGDHTVAGSGDQDNDGIDDACDPTPTETKVDEDDDAYTNRGDNCPLVANGADPDNQKDSDTDSIGDACDQNPDTPDGGSASPVDVTMTADVTIEEGRTVPLVAGWNDVCHTGPAGSAGDVLAPLGTAVAIVYRVRPDHGFDRWIPGRSDISTMTTVNAYDQLIILMTSGSVWEQQVAVSPASVMLVPGWNSICYAGSDNDVGDATAGIAGKFVAVYRLTSGGLERYFPGRPDISNLGSLQTYDSIFVIATEGAEWVFDVPPGPTPTPTPPSGEFCAPVFPGTYNGTVTVGGAPAPDGTTIEAVMGGIIWAAATTSGGRYVFEVPQFLPTVPPCFAGGTLTFTCDGTAAAETPTWNSGLHDLNLTCGAVPSEDQDGDGLPDSRDGCPVLAEDFDGFQDADGCPEADNDMDGICDPWATPSLPACSGSDACPNVAEDYDAYRDTDGCPDPDNDGDGFPDYTDDCPATDWTAGPDGIADSGDEPHDEHGVPIQTREDYDGIIDTDGCHDSPGDDYDSDGFADEAEAYVGTDPTEACADPGGDDAWPPDTNLDTVVDITDAGTFLKAFPSAQGNPNYRKRLDMAENNAVIDVTDAGMFLMHFPSFCRNP